MSDEVERGDTYYEVQVDRETLVLLALGLLAVVVAAFLVGRWTAPAGGAEPTTVAAAEEAAAEPAVPAESAADEPDDVDGEPLFGSSPVSAEEAPPVSPVPSEPLPGREAAESPPTRPPSAERPAEREPEGEPPPAATAAGDWVVQVAAVKSSRDAEALKRRLERKGWSVRIIREGGLSKVQVGPYAQQSEAQQAERRLKREEGLSTWVKRS